MSNYEAVARYREKLGKEKLREITREYTKKVRSNPEYRKIENEKNKDRYRKKVLEQKIDALETKLETINLADKFIDKIVNDTINTIPEKRNRGRPKMTDEEKYNAKLKRLQMKKKNCKELE